MATDLLYNGIGYLQSGIAIMKHQGMPMAPAAGADAGQKAQSRQGWGQQTSDGTRVTLR